MKKKTKIIVGIIITFFLLLLSGIFFIFINPYTNSIYYDHDVTRIYSVKIKSNSTYTLFLPIAIDQNGVSSLMDDVSVIRGNAEIQIIDDIYGKCLQINSSGNVEIYASENFKCHFTEGGEDVQVPLGTTRPEKMTLSMSNVKEIISWGDHKEYHSYNTSTSFRMINREWAKERMHTLGTINWEINNDTNNASFSFVKASNITPDTSLTVEFLLAEEHKDRWWYQDQWEGLWEINVGWNKCYFYQDHPSSCMP